MYSETLLSEQRLKLASLLSFFVQENRTAGWKKVEPILICSIAEKMLNLFLLTIRYEINCCGSEATFTSQRQAPRQTIMLMCKISTWTSAG